MKILFILLLVHGALSQSEFGKSYLGESKLCHAWTCVNKALGLNDSLPSREQFSPALRSLLPPGPWQGVVDDVLDVCYGDPKPRRYTRTCPGQSLLHCVVDNLIDNCPDESLRQGDACAPISSLAGLKYMFSQSRYEKFDESIASEVRPPWFLKHYFNTKCCNLPEHYNKTALSECGFNTVVHYYDHTPKVKHRNEHKDLPAINTKTDALTKEIVSVIETSESDDPLDCCDISDFITPAARSECGFQTTWSERFRLNITEGGTVPPVSFTSTTTQRPRVYHDVKLVPLSCEKESCVFRKLNIISETGEVDMEAFVKLLDNFTNENPSWQKAKARVITKCLTRPIRDYDAECPINKVLACTFDVLTENCPHAKPMRSDPCKYISIFRQSQSTLNETLCQINSSKLRKNRRKYCDFPRFVPHDVLLECDVTAVNRIEFVQDGGNAKTLKWTRAPACKDTTPSALCLMSKMDVLNKYRFMDHFMVKDKLSTFTRKNPEWMALNDAYVNSLLLMPLYTDYCASQRKLMNVVDSMLMTCPVSKRKNTEKCNKLFVSMTSSIPQFNVSGQKHYHHTFHELTHSMMRPNQMDFTKKPDHFAPPIPHMKIGQVHKKGGNSIFENFLFRERNLPEVRTLSIKPTKMYSTTRLPLILAPVYVKQAKRLSNDNNFERI